MSCGNGIDQFSFKDFWVFLNRFHVTIPPYSHVSSPFLKLSEGKFDQFIEFQSFFEGPETLRLIAHFLPIETKQNKEQSRFFLQPLKNKIFTANKLFLFQFQILAVSFPNDTDFLFLAVIFIFIAETSSSDNLTVCMTNILLRGIICVVNSL